MPNPDPHAATPKPSHTLLYARIAIILAGVLWSSSGLFAKLHTFDDWPEDRRGIALSFWRACFATLAMLPFVRKVTFRWELLPMGICFALMVASFLSSMIIGSSANAIWLQYTAPAFVLLGGFLFWRERWDRRSPLLFVPAMLGVAYILYFEIQQLQTDRAAWAVALGLFSAITYAIVVLCIRHLRHVDTAWIVVVNQSMTVLCLLPWVIAWGIVPSGSQWLWLALFGALQMALPYLLFSWGLKHVPGAEATLLTLVEPILVPVWAYLTRGEEPKVWTIHGAGIILLGLLLRYGLELYEQRQAGKKNVY
jgi:drug/metabolite transporter, DME family